MERCMLPAVINNNNFATSAALAEVCALLSAILVFRLDALALSVIATATWLAGWVAGCPSQPVLYQND